MKDNPGMCGDVELPLTIVSELIANHFSLESTALTDTFRVDRLRAPGTFRVEDGILTADQADLIGDFGKVAMKGSLDLGAASGLAQALRRPSP